MVDDPTEQQLAVQALHDDELEPEQPSDAAYGDEDVLDTDSGLAEEEIHPEPEAEAQEITPAHDTQADDFAAEAVAPGPNIPADPATTKHWYIVHAYSGFEQKVAESLRTRAQAFGFADRLGQLLIPTEEVVELRNGKKVTSKRLLYPGYVLIEMEMDDELWHAVKSTPRVTGFVGGGHQARSIDGRRSEFCPLSPSIERRSPRAPS